MSRFCNDAFSFPGQHTVFECQKPKGHGDQGWDTNHVFDDECEGRTFTVIWSDPDEVPND